MNTRTLPEFFPDEESRRRFLAVSVVMDRLMREETHEESDSDRVSQYRDGDALVLDTHLTIRLGIW